MKGKQVSVAELRALSYVFSHPGSTARQLAYISGMDNAHAKLQRLGLRGLVERVDGGWRATSTACRHFCLEVNGQLSPLSSA